VPYEERLALFETRVAEIDAHNAQDGMSWTETVNEFADATHAELNSLLGYRRVGPRWFSDGGFIQLGGNESDASDDEEFAPVDALSDSVGKDWRTNLTTSMKFFRNQGACGSCWAVAAAGAIEMHAEINSGDSVRISHTELVNCVQNPKHCGGSGGCHGATAELAYEYVAANGVSAENDKSFTSQHAPTCKKPTGQAVITVEGHKTLPVNKLQPLLSSLMHVGPAAVSVDGAKWSFYHSGVFAGCKMDTVVNHAVLLIGFGYDKTANKKYWQIRNSWGPRWGEAGLMRIERHSDDIGNAGYCGWDNKPKDGVFCDDAPEKVPVCGMCGILSDSAYPVGAKLVKPKTETAISETKTIQVPKTVAYQKL